MSVRQYIGARYVPRFSPINGGVWDNSYSYEALEIVKYGNDYYTSKIPVPVGTAITNTTYWVKTGDYNGAISGLDSRVTNIENDIRYSDIKDRNVMFFSDSFDLFNPGVSWCARVAELLGVNSYHKYSKNGGGFIGNSTDTAWVDGIDASASWASTISDVIIVGGWNDRLHNDNALDAAAGGFFTQLRLAYTNVKRIYLAQSSYTNDTSANMTYSLNMFNRYSKIANKYGCIYLSGVENVLRNVYAYFDAGQYVHPNTAGVEALAQGITTAIKSGCVNTSYHESISNCGSIGLDVAASSSGSISADIFGNDKNSKIVFLTDLSFTVSETVNPGSSKKLLTLSDHIINMVQLMGLTQILLYVSPDGIAIPETVFPTTDLKGLQMYVNSKLETGKTYVLQRFELS